MSGDASPLSLRLHSFYKHNFKQAGFIDKINSVYAISLVKNWQISHVARSSSFLIRFQKPLR